MDTQHGGDVSEKLYLKYGRVHRVPESVDPWLDSKGDMRLHATVKERPGCVVFEVEVKIAVAPDPSPFDNRQSFYWSCVACHVVTAPLTMAERRQMRQGYVDLVSIKMGRPYKMRGKKL